jgi:hypothetical protein
VAEKPSSALEFAERFRPLLRPGHPDTCEVEVFERTANIVWERNRAGDLFCLAHDDRCPGREDPLTRVQETDRSTSS